MYNCLVNSNDLESEIIKYIENFFNVMNYESKINLDSNTLLLEQVIGFDSLELAGLVAHLENLTNYDPLRRVSEFFTIGELARLFSSK